MNVPLIGLEEINEIQLKVFKKRRQRRVLFDDSNKLVYKIWDADWEFADQLQAGLESGYYDEVLVPNLVGLVRDRGGRNRGYVMSYIPAGRRLDVIVAGRISRATLAELRRGRTQWRELWQRPVGLNKIWLKRLLDELFSRAQQTGWLFVEVSLPNIWIGESGYHVMDLDALRKLDWIFCKDEGDLEYERKRLNALSFNRSLNELMQVHGLKPPQKSIGAIEDLLKLRATWF